MMPLVITSTCYNFSTPSISWYLPWLSDPQIVAVVKLMRSLQVISNKGRKLIDQIVGLREPWDLTISMAIHWHDFNHSAREQNIQEKVLRLTIKDWQGCVYKSSMTRWELGWFAGYPSAYPIHWNPEQPRWYPHPGGRLWKWYEVVSGSASQSLQ